MGKETNEIINRAMHRYGDDKTVKDLVYTIKIQDNESEKKDKKIEEQKSIISMQIYQNSATLDYYNYVIDDYKERLHSLKNGVIAASVLVILLNIVTFVIT